MGLLLRRHLVAVRRPFAPVVPVLVDIDQIDSQPALARRSRCLPRVSVPRGVGRVSAFQSPALG